MKNFNLLVALKNDVVDNTESIKINFGNNIPKGCEEYLRGFLLNNPQFNGNQEQFNIHISYVSQLFNEYIY